VARFNLRGFSPLAPREALKNTLGNPTLLIDARNPSLGNLNLGTERHALHGSLLKLNHEIKDLPCWTEDSIRVRAVRADGRSRNQDLAADPGWF